MKSLLHTIPQRDLFVNQFKSNPHHLLQHKREAHGWVVFTLVQSACTTTSIMNGKLVIDFTAFTARDKSIIVKEVSVIDVESQCVQHFVFKPPKDTGVWDGLVSRQYQWFSMHHHGLDYFDGSIEYSSLGEVVRSVCRDAAFIFAPSQDKAAWLENNVFNKSRVVFNLELFGCLNTLSSGVLFFPVEDDKNQCLLHQMRAPGFYCTQSNVTSLAKWCSDNADKLDMNKAANREKSFAKWSIQSPSPQQLAAEGFVKFASGDDMTRCVYCGVDLHQWMEADEPAKDHEKYSPFCDVVMEANDATVADKMKKAGVQCDCGRCFQPKEDRQSRLHA